MTAPQWAMREVFAGLSAALVACTGDGSPVDRGPTEAVSGETKADAAWRAGRRDSTQAVALACELAWRVGPSGATRKCTVENFGSTSDEYIIRVRVDARGASPTHAAEIALAKAGNEATVRVIANP
jgi:hypothetical protein